MMLPIDNSLEGELLGGQAITNNATIEPDTRTFLTRDVLQAYFPLAKDIEPGAYISILRDLGSDYLPSLNTKDNTPVFYKGDIYCGFSKRPLPVSKPMVFLFTGMCWQLSDYSEQDANNARLLPFSDVTLTSNATFIVPDGVSQISLTAVGAGGAGGIGGVYTVDGVPKSSGNTIAKSGGSGGGGGGALINNLIPVTSRQVLDITVGKGVSGATGGWSGIGSIGVKAYGGENGSDGDYASRDHTIIYSEDGGDGGVVTGSTGQYFNGGKGGKSGAASTGNNAASAQSGTSGSNVNGKSGGRGGDAPYNLASGGGGGGGASAKGSGGAGGDADVNSGIGVAGQNYGGGSGGNAGSRNGGQQPNSLAGAPGIVIIRAVRA